ncbi:MAG TPA: hypothetical protein DD725_00685 [Deltaproteobacteria bacterium]|nr:hypothetical protein [Deltaproteobacteria bacterium]
MGKRGFNIIANWMQGTAISGGDRIFIELSRRWASKLNIMLFISQEGLEICKRENLEKINYKIWSSASNNKYGYFINYCLRTFKGIVNSFQIKIEKGDIIYSSSDFWPDSIPAFFVKLRNPEIIWIAGFYLFAPNPWQKISPYKGKNWFIGLFFWFTQLPIFWIVKKYADMVFVTSEPDVEKFITDKRDVSRVIVIRGGVDTRPSAKYFSSNEIIPFKNRKYDACFIGRFHPQKGVLELIDIWKDVCKERPEAKLAVIGTGPLENEIKDKIEDFSLANNIGLLGFRDGEEKYEVFKDSRIVVHPATYDSGGMAACEAFAWGLPGVSFDLEALKTYYPKGMIKTPCFELEKFAKNILKLLDGGELYNSLSKDALSWAREWDWEIRTREILGQIESVCQ